jgi:hypothetical protein
MQTSNVHATFLLPRRPMQHDELPLLLPFLLLLPPHLLHRLPALLLQLHLPQLPQLALAQLLFLAVVLLPLFLLLLAARQHHQVGAAPPAAMREQQQQGSAGGC